MNITNIQKQGRVPVTVLELSGILNIANFGSLFEIHTNLDAAVASFK